MKHFFIPRVGAKYHEQKLKELVVGVVHGCRIACEFHDKCSNPETVCEMEHQCPVYADMTDREYYRLSNSNEIEIQSFIDGDADYPSYSAFSYYMLGLADELPKAKKEELWERISFTNLLQFYHEDLHALPQNQAIYDEAYPALKEVIDELTPHIIYVWNSRVKECLKQHPEDLKYIGKANMSFGLSVYIFTPVGYGVKGNALRKIKYKRGIQSERHQRGWYVKLVRKHLERAITVSDEHPDPKEIAEQLAEIFMRFVEDGLFGASEGSLYFAYSTQYKWTSLLKGLFLSALKDEFPMLGRYTNTGIEAIFEENIATCKRDATRLTKEEKTIARYVAKHFGKSKLKGKTFYNVPL